MQYLKYLLFVFSFQLHAFIVDPVKHQNNVQILNGIIDGKKQIDEVGNLALKKGFDTSAYGCDGICYSSTTLWEGGKIPLTYFVYIWPPEDAALLKQPESRYYETSIHSHPLPCALMVLKNSIVEATYQPIDGKWAKIIGEETLSEGSYSIDDNTDPFVHKLVCRDQSPAVTLHAYGAGSAKKVYNIMKRTQEACTFEAMNP